MTGTFVFGFLMVLLAAIVTVVYCDRRQTPLSWLDGD
jgi:hypothetical protein